MKNYFSDKKLIIGEERETPFSQKNGIFQDGTTPMYRDTDGRLWAISGHSHCGHIGMFCGTNPHDLKEVYPVTTNFTVGKAGEAFNGIRYPDGIESRGSVWPFGLYICPETHRFFVFFHNETGWAGQGTAYDSNGLCETPFLDSDFRHVGLMHSDDEGRSWNFDRWVLTAETVSFTEKYNPNGDSVIGQKYGLVSMGAGDFSCYVEEDGDFIYLFYNIIKIDLNKKSHEAVDVYVARTRKRSDGVMGDFVKYYDGSFCEAGNFGKETPVVYGAWHAKVCKLKDDGVYMMSASRVIPHSTYKPNDGSSIIERVIELRSSDDLIHWSDPVAVTKDGVKFGNHYCAFYSANPEDNTEITGSRFVVLLNGNGTDVKAYDAELVKE